VKVESGAVIALAICVFLSFYCALFTFQTTDDTLKKQALTVAASTLVTGVIIMAFLTIYLGMKKAFSRIEDQSGTIREQSKPDED
jgi:hypothetical protein